MSRLYTDKEIKERFDGDMGKRSEKYAEWKSKWVREGKVLYVSNDDTYAALRLELLKNLKRTDWIYTNLYGDAELKGFAFRYEKDLMFYKLKYQAD